VALEVALAQASGCVTLIGELFEPVGGVTAAATSHHVLDLLKGIERGNAERAFADQSTKNAIEPFGLILCNDDGESGELSLGQLSFIEQIFQGIQIDGGAGDGDKLRNKSRLLPDGAGDGECASQGTAGFFGVAEAGVLFRVAPEQADERFDGGKMRQQGG